MLSVQVPAFEWLVTVALGEQTRAVVPAPLMDTVAPNMSPAADVEAAVRVCESVKTPVALRA